MAAGLAHELNNPAAAARRAASDMCEALDVLGSTVGHFVESGIEREEAARLVALQQRGAGRRRGPDAGSTRSTPPTPRTSSPTGSTSSGCRPPAGSPSRSRRRGSTAAGSTGSRSSPVPATGAAVEWVAASLTARTLAEELRDSAQRIGDLVGAIKSYAYMDRGALVEADVHEGLETTLVMLAHKLKHTAIERRARLRPDAADASSCTAPSSTRSGRTCSTTRSTRSGSPARSPSARAATARACSSRSPTTAPGSPAEVLDRVFDPFFTTKDVGAGTGLGLDTARRIVADRHDGSITVDAAPGATTFHVWLPIKE